MSVSRPFLYTPRNHRKIIRIRLYTDLVGITIIRFIAPITHSGLWLLCFNLYSVLAWITILRLEPKWIPEFSTTRINQKRSIVLAAKLAPVLVILFIVIGLVFYLPFHSISFSIHSFPFLILSSYMDELLFRNIIQSQIRRIFRVSGIVAIVLQSILYTAAYMITGASVAILLCAFCMAIVNGIIVYRYRSLWAAATIGLLCRMLILS